MAFDSHSATVNHRDKQRLTNNAALQRSIRHRFPYIDPLHHLQVELVRRYRAGQSDERVQRGIHISINGIAAHAPRRAKPSQKIEDLRAIPWGFSWGQYAV